MRPSDYSNLNTVSQGRSFFLQNSFNSLCPTFQFHHYDIISDYFKHSIDASVYLNVLDGYAFKPCYVNVKTYIYSTLI